MRGEAAAQRASALARSTLLIKPPALMPPLMPKGIEKKVHSSTGFYIY